MRNEANWERIARGVVGMLLVIVGFATVGGALGVILGIVGIIALVTGVTGFCPLYKAVGFKTN